MTTIAKGVIEGVWTLTIGWILPTAISLLLLALVFPQLLADWGPGTEGAALLVGAVVLGWFLAALSTPLYRILEGYLLWPRRLRRSRIQHHQRIRRDLEKNTHSAVGPLECALADVALHRYPESDEQLLPTRFGNAIRSFECYSQDRYKLDAVTLWPHLVSSAPERSTREVNEARAGVDFFVCLFYTQAMVSITTIVTMAIQGKVEPRPLTAAVTGAVIAVLSYRGAIAATDSWGASVRALVDLGRQPLAAAYGISLPESLHDERRMWKALYWFVNYPYSDQGASMMNEFRVKKTEPDSPRDRPHDLPALLTQERTGTARHPSSDSERTQTR